jgi:hypothetical protein
MLLLLLLLLQWRVWRVQGVTTGRWHLTCLNRLVEKRAQMLQWGMTLLQLML